jgi:geranylgeranyl pyrophosphate synthase
VFLSPSSTTAPIRFLEQVRELISRRLEFASKTAGKDGGQEPQFLPGKMLRTRLAQRLANSCGCADEQRLLHACAATEMVHTASLCHDDVIDKGRVRRGAAALWTKTGPEAAVLLGDVLLCEAILLLLELPDHSIAVDFLEKVREVVASEAEGELRLRNRTLDADTCLHLCRGKTGPLFAFAATACVDAQDPRRDALERAGYFIGTAYQIADDILDTAGNEKAIGKSLHTDELRGKFTLARMGDDAARKHLEKACRAAVDVLAGWNEARRGVEEFLREDVAPLFDGIDAWPTR